VPGLAAGLRATVRAAVTDADTAEAMGSGNVPVLATPRLLALAEAATVAAVDPHLAGGRGLRMVVPVRNRVSVWADRAGAREARAARAGAREARAGA
jgi:fluoroacetyl-CoA thioesterase